MKLTVKTTLFALAVLTLAGCRKDLCYNHDEHSYGIKVEAVTEWELEWERRYDYDWKNNWNPDFGRAYDALRPSPAKGVRALAYADGGYSAEANLPAEGGRLPLREGENSVLMYNNDTEYIVFDGMSASATATATTRSISRASFKPMHAGERTMNQPDQLYGHYIPQWVGEKTVEPTLLSVTMRPLTYTYLLRYEFSQGTKYVALARGALAGMAEKVFLDDGHTGNAAATVMFDCEKTSFGAEALIKTFGVPNYPGDHYTRADGSPSVFSLNLEVRMTNGKIKNFQFDVTSQLLAQPRGGVITVSGIEITDEEGLEGSGSFNPDVDGWGEWQDIPLPI